MTAVTSGMIVNSVHVVDEMKNNPSLSRNVLQLRVLELPSDNSTNRGLTLLRLSVALEGILMPTMSPDWTGIGDGRTYS